MQTDGLKHIKWLSSHRQAYGFSPRIYNIKVMVEKQKDPDYKIKLSHITKWYKEFEENLLNDENLQKNLNDKINILNDVFIDIDLNVEFLFSNPFIFLDNKEIDNNIER